MVSVCMSCQINLSIYLIAAMYDMLNLGVSDNFILIVSAVQNAAAHCRCIIMQYYLVEKNWIWLLNIKGVAYYSGCLT